MVGLNNYQLQIFPIQELRLKTGWVTDQWINTWFNIILYNRYSKRRAINSILYSIMELADRLMKTRNGIY